ncbi:MAG: hypothetical protein ACPG6P_13815, partial [Akkermansiaceae bacterium]
EFPGSPHAPSSQSSQLTGPTPGRFSLGKVIARWWWLGVICIIGVAAIVSMIPKWMDMGGPLYKSTALVQVERVGTLHTSTHIPSAPMTRTFMNTQFEIIESTETIKLALADQSLLDQLGGNEATAIRNIKANLRTSQRRGTDLIEISYRNEDPTIAKDVTAAIYKAYKKRIEELELVKRKQELAAIRKELKAKSEELKLQRKRLTEIARKVGITWGGEDAKASGSPDRTARAREIQEFNLARKEYRTALKIKDQMQVKYDVEKAKMMLPLDMLTVHEEPEIALSPSTQGREFISAVGAVASLPFSAIAALILMYLAEAMFPRKVR